MGLFDSALGGTEPKDLTKHEAYLGILLAANAADGHVSEEEVRGFVGAVLRMKLFNNWNPDQINRAIDKMLGLIKRKGAEPAMEACAKALPSQLHRAVFANAVDLVLADGVVEEEEKQYINKLRAALGLSGDEAQQIAQVIVWKNQC